MPIPARLSRSLLIAAVAVGLPAMKAGAQASGVATWELVSPQRPIPRTPRGAAYDRVRKKLVMLGAGHGESLLWEWDGAGFQGWLPAMPRPDLENAGVVLDTDRNRLMLVAQNSLWELDSANRSWQEVQPVGPRPPPRRRPLVAYGNQRLYVLGGEYGEVLNDLWSWDPATRTWTQHASPPASLYTRLMAVWDVARARLVVAFGTSSDHQEWDPATQAWTTHTGSGFTSPVVAAVQYDPTSQSVLFFGYDWSVWQWVPATSSFLARTPSPGDRAPRTWFVTGYDEGRARFVLVGGTARTGQTTVQPQLEDAWEWNPADNQWSHAGPSQPHPGERMLSSAVYLPRTGQVMVAGGNDLNQDPAGPADWFWDPNKRQWTGSTSSSGPRDIVWPSLAYDSIRDVVVLFGGSSFSHTALEDLWELNVATGQWLRRPVSGTWPAPRYGSGLTFDEQHAVIELQGGLDQGSLHELTDQWGYNGLSGTFHRRSTTSPPDGGPGSLFYDTPRNTLVFVSTGLSVWERPDGSPSWALQGDFPTDRRWGAVAFDRVRRKILAHGGTVAGAGLSPGADLWEWDVDRRTWSQVPVQGPAPSTRFEHVMVFDPARGTSFLYGGNTYETEDLSGGYDTLGDGWELTIGHLPTGERCQASRANLCESGFCVNGRCCPSAINCRIPDGGPGGALPDAGPDGPDFPPDAGPPDVPSVPPDVAGPLPDGGVTPDAPAAVIDPPVSPSPDARPDSAPDAATGTDAAALVESDAAVPPGLPRRSDLYSSPGCALVPAAPTGGPALLLLLPVLVRGWRRWRRARLAAVTLVVLAGVARVDAAPRARWEPVAPPGLQRPTAATYDTVRNKVVAVQQTLDDAQVWDWDGQRWTPWLPEAPRPDLRDGLITFDSARGRLVLVTNEHSPIWGYQLVIWELDTTTRKWEKVEPVGTRPPARWGTSHRILYDPDRKRLYLTEGYSKPGGSYSADFLHDAWEWDAAARTWTERPWDKVNAHPGHRVYDAARARLVAPVVLGGVFEWSPADGTWQEPGDGTEPPDTDVQNTNIVAAGYDPIRKVVIAFGENQEVWQWNSVTAKFTTRVAPLPGGTRRYGWGAYAYDAARGRFVFAGGIAFPAAPQDDLDQRDATWEWDPATDRWSNPRAAQPNPGGVSHGSAVYLSGPDRILLVGGDRTVFQTVDGPVLPDDPPAWIWRPDLRTWVMFASRRAPRSLRRSGLAHDTRRDVAVLFGGSALDGTVSDQFWELRLSDNQWSQPPLTAGPAARGAPGLVYHPERRTVLLQGGEAGARIGLLDGWEWDAQAGAWRPRKPAESAPAGAGALFHDAARDILLFVTSGLQVWEGPAGGGSWTKVGQPPAPVWSDPGVTFDSLRRKVVVWGGRDPLSQQDTGQVLQWDVDSRTWSAIETPGLAPRARHGHVLVYDPRRESFFAYGGRSSAFLGGSGKPVNLGDGWELNIGDLPAGERCTATHADRCASGSCMNGLCCLSSSSCAAVPAPDAAAPDAGPPDAALPTPDQRSADPDAAPAPPPADALVADASFDGGVEPADGDVADLAPPEAAGPTANRASPYAAPGCSAGGRPGPTSPVLLLLLLLAARRRRPQ